MELLDIHGKVEEAFGLLVAPHMETGGMSVLQVVKTFFSGKPGPRRCTISAGDPECIFRDEAGSPLVWRVEVALDVRLNTKDDGADIRDLVAMLAEATYGGRAVCTALNSAMGKGFNALSWESDARRTASREGKESRIVIVGTLELQPWSN